jgi:hypothetical protein
MANDSREDRIRRYAAGPGLLRQAWDRVPEEARTWRPGPGRWSAHEVVCHCADSETNAYLRIRCLAAEPEPLILGYDQDRWAVVFDYHAQSPDLALRTVEAVRASTAALLVTLADEVWTRQGRHTQSGAYSAEGWLTIYAEHLEKHAGQIDRTRAAWEARPR